MTVSERPDVSVTTLHRDDGRIASRVLVVEPDPQACALHRQWLEQIGCEVVEAFDGRDALVKALMCQPALVLTEIELPFFGGHALCELLRRDSTTRTVPIVVVTTERDRGQFGRARAAGADAFLAKPATRDALLTHIRHLLAPSCKSHSTPVTARAATATDHHRYAATTTARSERDLDRAQSRAHDRFETATPPQRPPSLVCPSCDRPLRYRQSHVGGVSARYSEQWDEFVCPPPGSCGAFEYRQRTRKLRRVW
jgi:CheY-like chemotaxis protein